MEESFLSFRASDAAVRGSVSSIIQWLARRPEALGEQGNEATDSAMEYFLQTWT